jgi:acyl-CoA dehydrogenase|tara:strand:+ start:1364 stop:1645 length:282 start_codon:yes stop_codon:yes gene_type:complete
MPGVYRNIATRALQIHGSLGVSWEMPFTREVMESFHMGLADGPTEVHKVQVARRVLDDYVPCDDLFPSTHLPKQREAVLAKYADVLERHLETL